MIDHTDSEEVKKITEELLNKLQADYFSVAANVAPISTALKAGDHTDVVEIEIKLQDPQMFIGQAGQTLLSLQRIVGIVAGRRLKKNIYVQLDINDYKKQKTLYLKTMAETAANEVATTRAPKTLPPMSAYERRIIHTELSQRIDVATQSQGEGDDRSIVIVPR